MWKLFSPRAQTSHRALLPVVAALCLTVLASGCQADGGAQPAGEESGQSSSPGSTESTPSTPPVEITTSLGSDTQAVPITSAVTVSAQGGDLRSVKVRSGDVVLPGKVAPDKASWTSTGRLEPSTAYTITSVALDGDGEPSRSRSTFRTQDLTLDQQTYPSVAPLAGETVGVGMPVIVTYDLPVTDKALFERHMKVMSTPAQPGSWHWLTDKEVHWRPNKYWQAGTSVSVDVDVNSLPAGNGIFGQESRVIDFEIGDAVISKVSATTHRMKTFVNGKLVKNLPITTGKPGFVTRSGVKVIMEKHRAKRMSSETIGMAHDAPEGYNIGDVEYAMRLTYSGEFIHAAPWSVGSQGNANVSHGCTGMSTANAAWIYSISKRGDVVEYTGTDRKMSLTNGFGDWNLTAQQYAAGSALS